MPRPLDRDVSPLRPRPGAHANAFDLTHPLGLRALSDIPAQDLGGARVYARISPQHLLECRADVEHFLAIGKGPTLVLALRGPLSFSERELARVAAGVPIAMLESAVSALLDWSRR